MTTPPTPQGQGSVSGNKNRFTRHFGGFARQSRSPMDARIGFVIHTDRMNVLLSDWDERSSKFNFGLTLCLFYWSVGFTIYL